MIDRVRPQQRFLPLDLVENLEQRLILSAAPVVLSINRSAPAALVTAATTVAYTVTFSEPVTGVDPTDFQLALNGVTAITPLSVTGSGAVYTVTVNGISGNGTLGLNLGDNNSIRDLAGRALVQPNAPVTFAPGTTLAAGKAPSCVVTADVNGDGKADLIVSNQTDNTVSVLLGNGDGTFKPQVTYAAGQKPTSVTVADLTGDGKPDLLVTDYVTAGPVLMLRGNGDGTFQAGTAIATGTGPRWTAVADVNKDGKPDVLIAFTGNFAVGELLGNGNGTFQPLQFFVLGNNVGPFIVAVADLNGDGNPDVVACNSRSTVSVLLGSGTGTFQNPLSFPGVSQVTGAAIVDVNGDGKLDVVVGSLFRGAGILFGNGDGTFQPLFYITSPDGAAYGMAVDDVNGDGIPDVVAGGIEVYLGRGDGTFVKPFSDLLGTYPDCVVIGDVNGDGRPDVVTANKGNSYGGVPSVSLFLGTAHGGFAGQTYTIDHVITTAQSIVGSAPAGALTNVASVSYTVTFSGPVTGVDVSDFSLSLSGTADATVTQVVPVSGSVYTVNVGDITGAGTLGLNLIDDGSIRDPMGKPIGSSAASFAGQSVLTVYGDSPNAVVAADMNGDGKLDLVVNESFSSSDFVAVFPGNGDGTFQPALSTNLGIQAKSIALADVNGDGKPDVVAAGYRSGFVAVLLGNGGGTFQSPRYFSAGSDLNSVAVSDINGDGKPDLVVDNFVGFSGPSTVSVLLGNGDGTFISPVTFPTVGGVLSLAVADVNGDGRPDVVATHPSNTVGVLLGGANGTFQPEITFPVGKYPVSVAIGDLNGDGKPDLVVSNRDGQSVSALLGKGDGTFGPQTSYPAGSAPLSATIGDINGDGIPDVILANYASAGIPGSYTSDTASVLVGNGDGTFKPRQTFGAQHTPKAVATGDFNGDGRPDLVVANSGVWSVSVLLGTGTLGGQVYGIGRVAPSVQSISRVTPVGPLADATSVTYAVNFSEPVTGVDPADFSLALNGVTVGDPLTVSGSGAAYTVTVSGIGGAGTLGLNLVDDNSIQDAVGNRLVRGDGSIRFAYPPAAATGSQPYAEAVADLNGDGRPDLVVANSGDNTVSVLLGNGDGTFQPQQVIAVATRPVDVALGDVNGDDLPDVLVEDAGDTVVSVLLGRGDGTFRFQTYVYPFAGNALKLADLNGDGKLDLVGTSSIALGNGDGTFQSPLQYSNLPTSQFLSTGDFNNDGKMDVLVGVGTGAVVLALGNGNGTLQYPRSVVPPLGNGLGPITTADVNRDGRLDVVVGYSNTSGIYDLLGNGDGTFQLSKNIIAEGIAVTGVAADLNGDGKTDLALSDSSYVNLYRGLGNGSFGTVQQLHDLPWQGGFRRFISADLNGDGRSDLLATTYNNSVSPLVNIANGDFTGDVYAINSATPAVNSFVPNAGVEGIPTPAAVGSFTGQPQDTFTATVDYGDGSGPHNLPLSGNNFNLSNAYAEAGTYTVTVTVTDTTAGLVGAPLSETVTVADAPIQAAIAGAPTTIALGTSINLNFSATNPNPLEMGPLIENWTIMDASNNLVASGTGPSTTFTPAAAGKYAVTFSAGESSTPDAETGTATATITVTQPAPNLTSTVIGDGTAQRSAFNSLTLTFDEAVNLAAGAFTMNKVTTGTTTDSSNVEHHPILTSTDVSAGLAFTQVGDGHQWIVSIIPGGMLDNGFDDFLDGVYQYTLHASLITNSTSGTLNGGDQTASFLNRYGDIDGDGLVGNIDFGRFKTAFAKSANTGVDTPAFDIDHDGIVSNIDFGRFKTSFSKPQQFLPS